MHYNNERCYKATERLYTFTLMKLVKRNRSKVMSGQGCNVNLRMLVDEYVGIECIRKLVAKERLQLLRRCSENEIRMTRMPYTDAPADRVQISAF